MDRATLLLAFIVAGLVFYAFKYEYIYTKGFKTDTQFRLYYVCYLLCITATVVLQLVYVVQVDNSWPNYTVRSARIPPAQPPALTIGPLPQSLLFSAVGPVIDLLWHEFPGTGIVCLGVAQAVFGIRTTLAGVSAEAQAYGSAGCVLFGGSAVGFGYMWLRSAHNPWGDRHHVRTTGRHKLVPADAM